MSLSLKCVEKHFIFLAPLLFVFIGCQNNTSNDDSSSKKPTGPPPELHVLVVDDPIFVETMQRRWNSASEGKLNVTSIASDQLVGNSAKELQADVVIYPSCMLGELVESQTILAVPSSKQSPKDPEWNDLLLRHRTTHVTWGKKTVYGFSLGSPQFVLMYRQDIFTELGITTPRTWNEYESLAKRLSDRAWVNKFVPEGAKWSGVAEPWQGTWLAEVALAKSASFIRHSSRFSALFKFRSMNPLIDREPFVKVAQSMRELASISKQHDFQTLNPTDAKALLENGECAMAICWPEPSNLNEERTDIEANIGIAPLPGSDSVYNFQESSWDQRTADEEVHVPYFGASGRIASVLRTSKYSGGGFSFIQWLSNKENSVAICTRSKSLSPFRSSHLSNPANWVDSSITSDGTNAYVDLLRASEYNPVVLYSPRIPGRDKYIEVLAANLDRIVNNEQGAQGALDSVAASWRQISDELGVEKQIQSLHRSLGIED